MNLGWTYGQVCHSSGLGHVCFSLLSHGPAAESLPVPMTGSTPGRPVWRGTATYAGSAGADVMIHRVLVVTCGYFLPSGRSRCEYLNTIRVADRKKTRYHWPAEARKLQESRVPATGASRRRGGLTGLCNNRCLALGVTNGGSHSASRERQREAAGRIAGAGTSVHAHPQRQFQCCARQPNRDGES